MENGNRFNANVSGGGSLRSAPSPESDPFFIDGRSTAKAKGTRSGGVLARLAGRFWQILVLWLLISAPVAFLIFLFVPPTYEAMSLLRIESSQPEIFAPLNRGAIEVQNKTYLKTQVGLITSNRVLNPAIADSLVVNLPLIKNSKDPKAALLDKLEVTILEDANLIKVALELPNPDEAVTIVQSIVQSYLAQNTEYSRSANRDLTESLKQQLVKLGDEIKLKRESLENLHPTAAAPPVKPRETLNPKIGTDPVQPTTMKLTPEQFAALMPKQIQCDLEYIEALAHLEAARTVRKRHLDQIDEEMEARVAEEFKKDPKVVALMDQIAESKKLAESSGPAPSPAALAARARRDRLSKEYDALWADRRRDIGKRLAVSDQSVLSEAKFRELEVAVETARRKKEGFAQLVATIEVIRDGVREENLDATILTRQIDSLMNWQEIVKRNIEQLKFEASQDRYRVVLVDPASAPKEPSNNKPLQYMAIAPAAVFFVLVGLFLTQEIVAGRRAAVGAHSRHPSLD